MRPTVFPELIQFKASEGTQEAVKAAAREAGTTVSEYARQAIRAQLRRTEAAQLATGD